MLKDYFLNMKSLSKPLKLVWPYVSGDIPSDRSETVNRTCCVTGINNTCESTISIQVRNCGEFRVYYLQQLEKSRSGYCVGK